MNLIQNYAQLIAHLYQVNRFKGCRLGLQNMQALMQALNWPEKTFPSIHIAGTNGKGSVTTKIGRALQHAGYTVGVYTSPHIACFRERVQVNGTCITEAEVFRELTLILQIAERENIPATFFELTTALAFTHFAHLGVDVAVLETGLGGRFDATNCMRPLLSAISSIGLDHTDILGTTRDQIAWEKGGIIKTDVPVVVGPEANLPVIQALAQEMHSPLYSVAPLSGDFDSENSAIARQALALLKGRFRLTDAHIAEGIGYRPPCRFERVPQTLLEQSNLKRWPEVTILDVAHNPDAIRQLLKALDQHYPNQPYDFVCGFSKNKDVGGCLTLLKPKMRRLHMIRANHERALDLHSLQRLAEEARIPHECVRHWETPRLAMAGACEEAAEAGAILVICGTFFIMAEVRATLGYREPQDACCLNEFLSSCPNS
jgi:dihydrofolate synthase/folylpolyglutamate synthase